MPRKVCRCEAPAASPNPRNARTCNRCLGVIAYTSDDRTMAHYYTRLAEALFVHDRITGELMTEPWFDAFVHEAKTRERAGRDRFGHRHLTRNNRVDAAEEATDFGNYLIFDSLQECHRYGADADIDLVLEAMRHAALAYRATLRLAQKRAGGTGPGMDE